VTNSSRARLTLINAPQNEHATDCHVRVAEVVKYYGSGKNTVCALRGVTLELTRGEIVALCGRSGSGKTTLLNLLGCIDSVTTGEIFIGDSNISDLNEKALDQFRARELGFIFQTFNLLPVLSTFENVEYPLLKSSLSKLERRSRVLEVLKLVGLEKFAYRMPSDLSGGQRQRIAIARAIVHSPKLIIADEPTASLDKQTATDVLNLIADLSHRMKMTVVVATHDSQVMKWAQRCVTISDGLVEITE
jgi:putative ABC transport system ATP-binding protein